MSDHNVRPEVDVAASTLALRTTARCPSFADAHRRAKRPRCRATWSTRLYVGGIDHLGFTFRSAALGEFLVLVTVQ